MKNLKTICFNILLIFNLTILFALPLQAKNVKTLACKCSISIERPFTDKNTPIEENNNSELKFDTSKAYRFSFKIFDLKPCHKKKDCISECYELAYQQTERNNDFKKYLEEAKKTFPNLTPNDNQDSVKITLDCK